VRLDTGETVTPQLVRRILDEELAAIRAENGRFPGDSMTRVSRSNKLRWRMTLLTS
jgi:hypothetical protein